MRSDRANHRDAILNLLTDEEIARVSNAEVATGPAEGAEYLDLGVARKAAAW